MESANQKDAEQDAALGSHRGDELPDKLKRRKDRIEKIRAAKERLEAEAKARGSRATRPRRGHRTARGRRKVSPWETASPRRSDSGSEGSDELHRPRREDYETQQQVV